MYITNRYNNDEIVVPNHDDVRPAEQFVQVLTKTSMIEQIKHNMPLNVLFETVSSDVDMTKMSNFEKIDFVNDNPDLDPSDPSDV